VTGILDGKRLLITGVLTESSIAFGVAKLAQEQGATVLLSGFGRGLSITARIAGRLPQPAEVVELDVTDTGHLDALAQTLDDKLGGCDGVLHAIGFAPESALGGNFMSTTWEDVATAVHVSTYSFAALARAVLPAMQNASGGAIVGLDFDATIAWPAYDWMGVAKAGLESCSRYLARELGKHKVRVNLVAAGPLRTMAAKSIPGFETYEGIWAERAPLGWDVNDTEPAAKACVALLSDWFPATSGEIVHVDGGVHAVGA
jgi:enoyl-[acyl-carrier protein] reductase I